MTANSAFLGELYATMSVNTTALDHAVTKMKRFEHQVNASLARVRQSLQVTGASMKTFGRSMTQFMTLPIALVGGAAFKMYKDFEFSMNKVVSLVGVARKQVDEWSKAVLALAPSVGKSPRELADAMYFITSAGVRGKEAMEVLEESAKSAAGGLGEVKVVADLLSSAMNAYGKENLSAARANDILVATVREGKAEADLLAQSMGLVLPIASAMGATFDQVGAATAAMTRTGTKAATAAIQLRQIFNSILKPAKEAEAALGHMKTSSQELRDMIAQDGLLTALQKLDQLQKEYGIRTLGKVIPNIRSLTGVLDIMGKNAEENVIIFEKIRKSIGDANRMFKETAGTVQFRMQQALAGMQVSLVKIGKSVASSILPLFQRLSRFVQNVANRFEMLEDSQKKTIVTIAALAAALGPVVTILGFLIGNALPGIITLFIGLNKVVLRSAAFFTKLVASMVSAPFGLITTGLAGVVAGLALYAMHLIRSNELTKEFSKRGIDFAKMTAAETKAIRKRVRFMNWYRRQEEYDFIAYKQRLDEMEIEFGEFYDALDTIQRSWEKKTITPEMDTQGLTMAINDVKQQIKFIKDQIHLLEIKDIIVNVQLEFDQERAEEVAKALHDWIDKTSAPVERDLLGRRKSLSVTLTPGSEEYGKKFGTTAGIVETENARLKKAFDEELKAKEEHYLALSALQKQEQRIADAAQKVIEENAAEQVLQKQMAVITTMGELVWSEVDVLKAQISAWDQAMSQLAAVEGIGDTDTRLVKWAGNIQTAKSRLEELEDGVLTVVQVHRQLQKDLAKTAVREAALGDSFDDARAQMNLFRRAMNYLIDNEIEDAQEEITRLGAIIQRMQAAMDTTKGGGIMSGIAQELDFIKRLGEALAKTGIEFDVAAESLNVWLKGLEDALALEGVDQGMIDYISNIIKGLSKDLEESEGWEKWAEAARVAFQIVGGLFNALSQYYSVQMQNEIDAFEKSAKARGRSEQWLAKERERIQEKYAKKMQAMAVAEAIMNGALAVIRVFKDIPFPWSIPAAAVVAAMVGVQIATIKAQKMVEGGIVPPGYPKDTYPALLTSGEEVLPASQRRTRPTITPEVVEFRIEGTELVGILKKQMSLEENF